MRYPVSQDLPSAGDSGSPSADRNPPPSPPQSVLSAAVSDNSSTTGSMAPPQWWNHDADPGPLLDMDIVYFEMVFPPVPPKDPHFLEALAHGEVINLWTLLGNARSEIAETMARGPAIGEMKRAAIKYNYWAEMLQTVREGDWTRYFQTEEDRDDSLRRVERLMARVRTKMKSQWLLAGDGKTVIWNRQISMEELRRITRRMMDYPGMAVYGADKVTVSRGRSLAPRVIRRVRRPAGNASPA